MAVRYSTYAGLAAALLALGLLFRMQATSRISGATLYKRLAARGGFSAEAIVAAAAAEHKKQPCEWCRVIKEAASKDKSAEADVRPLAKKSLADYDWKSRLDGGLPRLAVIVPYRDRESNLRAFLKYMNDFLARQNAKKPKYTYWFLVMEQSKSGRFNRGKLCNSGFSLVKEFFDYFIFHDVDKLPEIDTNSYEFPNTSVLNKGRRCGAYHLASRVQQFDYKWMKDGFVGGTIMFTKEQFERIGGMPNSYWGWGAEDDETYDRIKKRSKEAPDICRHEDEEKVQRYSSMDHERAGHNGNAEPELTDEQRRRYQCHYAMMRDYRDGRRETDRYGNGVFRTLATVDEADRRATTTTLDLCWGDFETRCTRTAADAGCNKNRRFG
ncbi:beta-1,4-galactosyltransferase 7-like [Sycon ciliatum]|uniref:beta-1,4-galactosyltransferase 7-like n=1 Tax=Sycon ciliatum TaxID=27933 RepID=UPI0031F69DC5